MSPPTTRRRGAAALVLLAVLAPAAGSADEGEPFRTRNLSPLVSIFGIPAWSFGPRDGTHISFTTDLGNHYRFSQRGDEMLILDGETWRGNLAVEHAFGAVWSASIELPYYRQSGGVLDDVIDAWHSAFGLPDGGRDRREEDGIAYVLGADAGPFYALGRDGGAFGDVLVSLGRSFGVDRSNARAELRATAKLPTGDELWLAGSGSADFALTWLAARRGEAWGRAAAYYWGVGGLWLGEPDIILYDARRSGLMGLIGGGIRLWQRWGIKGQIEFHSDLYDSRLKEIGDPGVQATIGGWRDLGERGVVEFAINEDLAVSTSPDLVLHVHLGWSF